MDIQKEIDEKNQLFKQVTDHLQDLAKKIGTLQEEQRAIYNKGLEVKGALELLFQLKAKEEADKPRLTLPDKSLVAPDGKTVIATPAAAAPAPMPTASTEAPKAAVPGEVPTEPVKTPLEVI